MGMNKFRCIKKCTYGGRLWDPREGKIMTADEEEVPHFELIDDIEDEEEKGELEESSLRDSIKKVLLKMDPENDEQWTKSGLPMMEHVEEKIGDTKITRLMVNDALPGFNRDAEIGTMKGAKTLMG